MLLNNVQMEHIAGVVGHSQDLGMTFKYAGNVIPLTLLQNAVFSIKY